MFKYKYFTSFFRVEHNTILHCNIIIIEILEAQKENKLNSKISQKDIIYLKMILRLT